MFFNWEHGPPARPALRLVSSLGALWKAELREERSFESLKGLFCVEEWELNGSKNSCIAKGDITLR